MLLFIRKSALSWSLALALPAVGLGQGSFSSSGGEHLIAGSLPGDQTRPQLSLSPSGGYVVWEDNAIDTNGTCIAGVALDNSFSRVLAPFRISQSTPGNAERPQATLLYNGGAAFIWQGGPAGLQHIYARFSSPSNTWLGGDVRLSTPSDNFQVNPAIATLTNGNVVAVWGSYNQFSSSSMQDVYGRILTPAGTNSGPEFLINQFTAYNQRTPAVAALAGGGFIVVWVSEQQRVEVVSITNLVATASQSTHASLDVYGRLFNADGSAASDEFLINTGSDVCANPRVAGATNGGFMVVWGQKSSAVPTNGWDIFARAFSGSNPAGGGPAQTVNTTLYGDQYIPQVSVLGTNYLVVWTSLGQDGDQEGVYGQFLAGDGTPQGGEFGVNTTTVSRQMQPAVASDNLGRFVAVWTSYTGLSSRFDLEAQNYATGGFVPPTLAAAYQPVPPLPGDNTTGANTGLVMTSQPSVQYPGGSTSILTNGNATALPRATYSGLFYEAGGVNVRSSGAITAKTGSKGAYSAKLMLGGHSYSMSGHFSTNGCGTNTVRRGSGQSNLLVQLQIDSVSGNQLGGTIQSGADWTASIYANRQVQSGAGVQAGKYTLILPPDDNSANGPAGSGYGTMSLSRTLSLGLGLGLADGTKVTVSGGVSRDGAWPVYASLYGNGGLLMGWMHGTTNQADSDCEGQLAWVKPQGVAASYHPAGGFTNSISGVGSIYTQCLPGGSLTFSGGGLNAPLISGLGFDEQKQAVSSLGNRLSMRVELSTGLFQGTVTGLSIGKVSFQGVVFQKSSIGAGYFLGANQQSGAVDLSPEE